MTLRKSAGFILLTLLASWLHATPAMAADDKVTGQLEVAGGPLASMMPGQAGWTALVLQAKNKDLCHIEVTTTTPGTLSVTYPSERAYTAPYRDATLSQDEIDYIALRFVVPAATVSTQTVPLTFKWVDCKNDNVFTKTYDATLPITTNTGPAFVQETTAIGPIEAGTAAWIDVSYKGMSPDLTNFTVEVTDTAGATITYPAEGTSTKLANDSTLNVLTSDTVAFRVDTTGMSAGVHSLKTVATYGASAIAVPGTLTLTVS